MFDLDIHLTEVLRTGAPWFVRGWQPKSNSVFVMPLIETDRSRGGLILPDEHRERPQRGVVLAVGSGLWDDEQRLLIPIDVSVGDLVAFGKYSGSTFELERGLEVFIMVNPELKARKLGGTYLLVQHLIGKDTPQERKVYHEQDTFCQHCPPEPVDDGLAEERRRFQAEKAAELDLDLGIADIVASRATVGSIPEGGVVPVHPAAEPLRMTLAQGDGDHGAVNDHDGYCDKGCGDVGLRLCVCLHCGEGVYR